MGRTIWSPQLTVRSWCHRTSLGINVCSAGIYIAHLLFGSSCLPFPFPQASPHHHHSPTHGQVLRDWKSIKLKASHGTSLLFFSFLHLVPEGLSESVMTTKAADLRDSPRRRKRTAVHRHLAENSASNSWESDRLRSGWPPHSADVNLKQQPFPLICSWLPRLAFIDAKDHLGLHPDS